jgi:hypothetical protein
MKRYLVALGWIIHCSVLHTGWGETDPLGRHSKKYFHLFFQGGFWWLVRPGGGIGNGSFATLLPTPRARRHRASHDRRRRRNRPPQRRFRGGSAHPTGSACDRRVSAGRGGCNPPPRRAWERQAPAWRVTGASPSWGSAFPGGGACDHRVSAGRGGCKPPPRRAWERQAPAWRVTGASPSWGSAFPGGGACDRRVSAGRGGCNPPPRRAWERQAPASDILTHPRNLGVFGG